MAAGVIVMMAASATPAVVRRVLDAAGVAKLEISLSSASRPVRTLSRPAGEALRRSLQRLSGAKGGLDDAALAALAQLRRGDGTVIEHDLAAEEAWAAATELRLGSEIMSVLFDPPEVPTLITPAVPLCGISCTPYYVTRCCERADVVLTWSCQAAPPTGGAQINSSAVTAGDNRGGAPGAAWQPLGQGASFTPTAEHAGATLRVVATPPALPSQLPLQSTLVVGVIAAPPPRPVLASRLAALASAAQAREPTPRASAHLSPEARSKAPPSIRVLCYNLLADSYRRSWDEPGGVHSHCDPAFTIGGVRLPRLLSEILAANPDVACLQEVDLNWAETFWTPHLTAAGYSLSFAPKASASSSEGIAVLAKSSAFEVLSARTVRLDLRSPPPQLESYLSANPHTASAAGSLPTVAQIVRLRSRCAAGRILVVANTHLYFANPAVHVRLMQARALLAEVESEVEACRDLCGANGGRSSEVGVVVAGDLNSDSTDAAVQLLLERRISSSHRDWRVGALHWPPALGLAAHAADTARRLGDSLRRLNLAGPGSEAPDGSVLVPELEVAFGGSDPAPIVLDGAASRSPDDSSDDAGHRLRQVALSFHRLRCAIKLIVPADRLQRRAGGLLEVRGRDDLGEGGGGLAGASLAAAAAESVWRGETLLTSVVLAAVEVGAQTGRPPRLPPSDQDVAAALCRLQALGQHMSASQVGVPAPGIAGQPGTDLLPPCGADLSHGLELRSAYGVHTQPTHVTVGYANALDWLTFSPGPLRLRATAPLPNEAELRRHVALPSIEFPSDHVSLIADLEWSGETSDETERTVGGEVVVAPGADY